MAWPSSGRAGYLEGNYSITNPKQTARDMPCLTSQRPTVAPGNQSLFTDKMAHHCRLGGCERHCQQGHVWPIKRVSIKDQIGGGDRKGKRI